MKTIILPKEEASAAVAALVIGTVKDRPDALLALTVGKTPEILYRKLTEAWECGQVSFARTRFVLLTEYEGLAENDPQTCRISLTERFLGKVDAAPENLLVPSAENIDSIDEQIKAMGGIDLAVLGLGANGHFAYNEPTTQFGAPSHRQKLSPGTRRSLAGQFGSEQDVPAYAWTIGIRTIMYAKKIAVMAFGKEKAGPVFRMLYARDDSLVPAAFLQLPRDVLVYVDAEAASKLTEKEGNE